MVTCGAVDGPIRRIIGSTPFEDGMDYGMNNRIHTNPPARRSKSRGFAICPGLKTMSAAAAAMFLCPTMLAAKTVTIGNGSGHLSYANAQQALNLQPGDTLYIAPGTYTGLALSNLAGTADAPIIVRADPNAVFTTAVGSVENNFANISHVKFQDFQYLDYKASVMRISGASHDVTFQNYTITNASGYAFRIYDANKVFDGTKASAFYNFTWDNITVDGKTNGAVFSNQDFAPVSNLKSVLLDFTISNSTFKNFDNSEQAFSVISFDKAFNLKVHDNTFSDLGMAQSPIGHNVAVAVSGYAEVYNNTFTRQWANEVRNWPMKLNALGYDGPDAVTRFYNNISYEKRKYAMFEQNSVPAQDLAASGGYFSPTASEVYFNTLYRSRRADYVAPLVDIYGDSITVAYNLIIDPETDLPFNPNRNYVYQLVGVGEKPGLVIGDNQVYATLEAAGLLDAIHFIPAEGSPVIDGVNGTVPYILKDIYGNTRYFGGKADFGAVEYVPEPTSMGTALTIGTGMLLRRRPAGR
jgi:hypothetical protein